MSYSDKVIDHYNNPRNVGSMDKKDADVGTGLVGAPECGDVMKLQIKVNPQTNIIEDAKFKTFGCGSAIASSSLATEQDCRRRVCGPRAGGHFDRRRAYGGPRRRALPHPSRHGRVPDSRRSTGPHSDRKGGV